MLVAKRSRQEQTKQTVSERERWLVQLKSQRHCALSHRGEIDAGVLALEMIDRRRSSTCEVAK